ncbi:MAG: hydantoinase B/oxoprolinase family protein, partial [Pseudomonadota bacterium]
MNHSPTQSSAAVDQLTLDILWDRLIGTVNEQAAALIRSSFTSIVREAGDLSAGVFDRRGRMVAQAVTGTPGHINSMATGMVHMLARHPVETLVEGDVLITNDPWMTASQLNDITIATPVFREGRLVAFFASCCHALDIGGRGLSADSRSVFEEGLALPILKLHEAGRVNQAILDILAANSRTPEEVLGDIHSQIVGNAVGARQLLGFLDEFGLADIEGLADAIVARSEAAMRAAIAALPDGTYPYALEIDGFEAPIRLACSIEIAGERLVVDFEGSSDAVPLGVNVALNYTRAYTTYGIKCAISPEVPNNEGAFRPVEIRAPEGSILNAKRPAAVGGRHLVGHFLPSLVMGALAGAVPDAVAASGADGLWDTHIAPTPPAENQVKLKGRPARSSPAIWVSHSPSAPGAATASGTAPASAPMTSEGRKWPTRCRPPTAAGRLAFR